MPKILITTGIFYPDSGGPAVYGQTLAKYLGDKNKVSVISYSSAFFVEEDKNKNYRVLRVWRRWPKPLRQIIYLWRVFWSSARNDRILVLNHVGAGPGAILAGKIFKKKVFVRISGDKAWETAVNRGKINLMIDDFQNSKKAGSIAMISKVQNWVCRRADVLIAHSKYLAKLAEGWGVAPERIKLIYTGIDFEPSIISREEARKEIGIPGNILFSWGRLVTWKGFRMLIKIMPQLLQINQFFRLVIAGDGPEQKILESMTKNLGLDKKVYFVGKKSRAEIAKYLAAADFFVYNTGYEGLSHQIMESMMAGVPVITTNVGGNPELIKQGENGFMVKYNDEFNLVEAIKTLWQDQELRDQFSKKGKETLADFSVAKMLKETEELITG